MAEALLNQMCGHEFEAQSAGLSPGRLNPLAVEVMREIGIDISGKKAQSVFDIWKSVQLFAYVITVSDDTSAEQCPISLDLQKCCIGAFQTQRLSREHGKKN